MFKMLVISLLVMTAGATSARQVPAGNSTIPQGQPCGAASYRQLDFWVGEWNVFKTGDNVQTASSRIEHSMGDCGIKESFTSANAPGGKYSGTSYSSYDRKDGKWHQMYIDTNGSVGLYVGGLKGADMEFIATGREGVLNKMTYRPLADGSVEQIGMISADQGKTWQAGYDLTYRKK